MDLEAKIEAQIAELEKQALVFAAVQIAVLGAIEDLKREMLANTRRNRLGKRKKFTETAQN